MPRRTRPVYFALIPALVVGGSCAIAAPAATWEMTTGLDYSKGSYGDPQDTKITYLPVSLSYATGPWKAKATVSWLRIDGPGTVIGGGGGGGIVVGPTTGQRTTESGIGDTWLSLRYSVESIPSDFGYVDITGKIKAPTADKNKGLGTGEFDYTIQADYYKPLGRLTPLLTVAYKVKGDAPHLHLDNVWYLSGGADWRANDDLHFGATIDYQQAAVSGTDDDIELFTYASWRLSSEWRLVPYAYFGFTNGSPDQGFGLQASYRF